MKYGIGVFIVSLFVSSFVSSVVFAGNLLSVTQFNSGDTATASGVNAVHNAIAAEVDDNADDILDIEAGGLFFGLNGTGVDVTISSDTSWLITAAGYPPSWNFNNFTIDSDVTLTVAPGTTIRCSGNFVNNGTIVVSSPYGPQGGAGNSVHASRINSSYEPPHPGDSFGLPGHGGTNHEIVYSTFVDRGRGGYGIQESTAITSFSNFRFGGGGGAGLFAGDGGGLIKIQCKGAVINNGVITANGGNGSTGSGGGAGGIVILSSATSIDSSGSIEANGGTGGSSNTQYFSGGGGGGGIVIFNAPSISVVDANISVAGGTGGDQTTVPSDVSIQIGGGGGGASGRNGGAGGGRYKRCVILTCTTITAAGSNAGVGYVIKLTSNPLY